MREHFLTRYPDSKRSENALEELLVAATLTVGALASAVQEGVLNGQSLRWNACALVLAVPLWWRFRKHVLF